MNWIIIDLDMTLVDTKRLIEAAGPEPTPPGTDNHNAWVYRVTDTESLKQATAVETVWNFVNLMSGFENIRIVFVTNRREKGREVTQQWLYKHSLHHPLYMRPDELLWSAGEFKESVITGLIHPKDTVTVVDDDPDGSIEVACKRNRWTHFKVTTY
jgi:hypothetical protein